MTARYQAIRAALEAQIHSGELAPGARLPTEAELQAEYGVSRATAQKALNELAQAGLVVRQRGRAGTHVTEGGQQVNLLRYLDPRIGSGFGNPGRHEVLSAEVIPASAAEVDLPGLEAEEPVTQVVRLKYDVDDTTPLTVEIAAIPFALAPRLVHEDLEHQTIRAYFIRNEVPVERSRMYLDPVLLSKHHADLLGVEPGVPVHRRRRLMWLSNGDLAESAAYYSPPGALELYVEYSVLSE